MLLTQEERDLIFKKTGNSLKHRCDVCKRPITSTLIYGTADGGEACSRACMEDGNAQVKDKVNRDGSVKPNKRKKEKHMAKEEKKSKKVTDDSDDDSDVEVTPKKAKPEIKAKKAKTADTDEDDAPKKSAKKVAATEDDEEPTLSKGNPYRAGSVIAEAFELLLEGVSDKKLDKFVEKKDVNKQWLLRMIKKHGTDGKGDSPSRWTYEGDDDSHSISLKKAKAKGKAA